MTMGRSVDISSSIEHDGLAQRLAPEPIGFPGEHTKQDAVLIDLHASPRLEAGIVDKGPKGGSKVN